MFFVIFFSPLILKIHFNMDACILDAIVELINEIAFKQNPTPLSPRSILQDVIKCLGILTKKTKVESILPHRS